MRGFTLLELLIGMTLLGFILSLLYGGLRLATSSWNTIEERIESSADEQAGRALVRRLITTAQPLHWPRSTVKPLAFDGDAASVRLIAPLTGQIGLQAIELAIEPNPGGSRDDGSGSERLVLRHGSLHFDADDFAVNLRTLPARPLLERLRHGEFSYFGLVKKGDPPQWLAQWTSTENLPLLVRLHLLAPDGSVTDLDMTPMVNGDRMGGTGAITAGPR